MNKNDDMTKEKSKEDVSQKEQREKKAKEIVDQMIELYGQLTPNDKKILFGDDEE